MAYSSSCIVRFEFQEPSFTLLLLLLLPLPLPLTILLNFQFKALKYCIIYSLHLKISDLSLYTQKLVMSHDDVFLSLYYYGILDYYYYICMLEICDS